MKNYIVNFTDLSTGATSPIDNIMAPEYYTSAQYISDCEEYGDPDYVSMIKSGIVTLEEIKEE